MPASDISAEAIVNRNVVVDVADVDAVVMARDVAEHAILDGDIVAYVIDVDAVSVVSGYVSAETVVDPYILIDVGDLTPRFSPPMLPAIL